MVVRPQAEQEKKLKDEQLRTLTAELGNLDENIARTLKEKRNVEETLKQSQANLAAEEEKVNNLTKLKQKLEQNVDEVYSLSNLFQLYYSIIASFCHSPVHAILYY